VSLSRVGSAGVPVVGFVHGCTQGPTAWDRVRPLLEEAGVPTCAVDLRPEELTDATVSECAGVIADATAAHERLVLVGTSCSGIITPVAATLRRVEHLVFICAGLPDIGRSVTDQIDRDGVLHEEWRDWSGAFDSPEAATRFMFNDCDAETLEWALSTVRLLIPLKVYDEVTPLKAWPSVPMSYVLGTEDRIIGQAWARRAVPERLGVSPIELPTGHCPQNSQPELLAKVIREIVASLP
jgi:pimeloyl-ACP methyl ester carboxylesterase